MEDPTTLFAWSSVSRAIGGRWRGALSLAAGLGALVLAPTSAIAAERSEVDRPDDYPGPRQVHVMYAVPSDGVDHAYDTNGAIASSVDSWQRWLRAQTGGRGLALDTYRGQLDVTFARLPSTDAQLHDHGDFIRDAIERDLNALRRLERGKLYAVHYDGTATHCGSGPAPETEDDVAGRGQQVAAVYLGAADCQEEFFAGPGQPPGYREFGVLHELLHGLGFVPDCAPNANASHVGDHPSDLMYAGPLGWVPSVLDYGHDDYFGTGRKDCPDLARSLWLEGQKPAKTKKKRGPSRTITKRKATFRFAGKRAASFECKLDKRRYKKCKSPKRVRRLRLGKHRFKVRALSEAGLPDPSPAVWKFRVRRAR